MGDHRVSSNNNSSDDDTVHPLVFAKTWVQVANDKVIPKIMHRLREKVKKDKTGGGNGNGGEKGGGRDDGEKIMKNEEVEEAFSSNWPN